MYKNDVGAPRLQTGRRLAPFVFVGLLFLGLGGLVGYAAGAATGGPPQSRRVAPSTALERRTNRRRSSLVCARRSTLPTPPSAPDCNCEMVSAWSDLMERQLAECEAGSRRVRDPWPTDLPPQEDPEAWVETVEYAFEECDVPGAIEVVDCVEYPCVAAVRSGSVGEGTSDAHADAEALRSRLDRCAPLRSGLSISEAGTDAIQVHPIEVACEDGSKERAQVVIALDPAGPAWSEFDRADKDIDAILRWYYRRTDDVMASWKCVGEQ